jgi:hypothetical protein
MTVFQQLRWWLRRAGGAEKAAVAVAVATVVALVAWALVPVVQTSPSGRTVAAGAQQPGAATAAASAAGAPQSSEVSTVGTATTQPAGGVSATSSGATTAAGPASGPAPTAGAGAAATTAAAPAPTDCGVPGATDQGVSAKEIRIAIVLLNLAGAAGNGLIGVPPVEQQQADFDAVIADINKNGGIQCRKLVPTYYQGNPLDQNQEHATCLQVVQDKPFAMLDVGAIDTPPSSRVCVPQAKIPLFDVVPILLSEAQKDLYPYMFTYFGQWDTVLRDAVLGARQLDWFAGAQKIGLLEEDCAPEMNAEIEADLAQIGFSGAQVSRYNYGCPGSLTPPNQTAQAVLQFKTGGVDRVIDVSLVPKVNDFSKQAQQQDYHPKYLVPDGGAVATYQNPQFAPDATNFDGALAITSTQYGGDRTPGLPLSAATQRCDAIMAAAGQPPVREQGVGFGGVACNETWMFATAAAHDQGLTRANMVNGLDQSGSLEMSFPQGPAKFDVRPRTVTGGQYWRPLVYDGKCPCFRVADGTFRPNFG